MSTATLTGSTVAAAAEILRGRRTAVLTGAGISTDSGIPDYRGRGTPARSPMSFQQFASDAQFRKRYWAGSHLGWRRFHAAQPNAGHLALTDLERIGAVAGVITQNVDDLHLRAGTQHVVELHGSMHSVSCQRCGQTFARQAIADQLTRHNPWLEEIAERELSPDGDVVISEYDELVVPECTVCGGMLKPDVIFFGEFVPPLRFAQAASMTSGADALLIAGSSLVVNSGIRIVEIARRRRIPIIIINRGETKADARAVVRIESGTSEALTALRDQLLD